MDNATLIDLLRRQFGEYLRDPEYKIAFDEALTLFEKQKEQTSSSTDNFYLFLHSLIIHMFGKIKSVENKLQRWEELITENQSFDDSIP